MIRCSILNHHYENKLPSPPPPPPQSPPLLNSSIHHHHQPTPPPQLRSSNPHHHYHYHHNDTIQTQHAPKSLHWTAFFCLPNRVTKRSARETCPLFHTYILSIPCPFSCLSPISQGQNGTENTSTRYKKNKIIMMQLKV